MSNHFSFWMVLLWPIFFVRKSYLDLPLAALTGLGLGYWFWG